MDKLIRFEDISTWAYPERGRKIQYDKSNSQVDLCNTYDIRIQSTQYEDGQLVFIPRYWDRICYTYFEPLFALGRTHEAELEYMLTYFADFERYYRGRRLSDCSKEGARIIYAHNAYELYKGHCSHRRAGAYHRFIVCYLPILYCHLWYLNEAGKFPKDFISDLLSSDIIEHINNKETHEGWVQDNAGYLHDILTLALTGIRELYENNTQGITNINSIERINSHPSTNLHIKIPKLNNLYDTPGGVDL